MQHQTDILKEFHLLCIDQIINKCIVKMMLDKFSQFPSIWWENFYTRKLSSKFWNTWRFSIRLKPTVKADFCLVVYTSVQYALRYYYNVWDTELVCHLPLLRMEAMLNIIKQSNKSKEAFIFIHPPCSVLLMGIINILS